jgi:hypothetical protein
MPWLARHKARSGLNPLGITIGVAAASRLDPIEALRAE